MDKIAFSLGSKTFPLIVNNHGGCIDIIKADPKDFPFLPKDSLGEHWWWFSRIFVDPSLRGKKYGDRLMGHLVKWLDREKVNLICGVSPYGKLSLNETMAFYKKYGFVSTREEKTIMLRRFKR